MNLYQPPTTTTPKPKAALMPIDLFLSAFYVGVAVFAFHYGAWAITGALPCCLAVLHFGMFVGKSIDHYYHPKPPST